MPKIKWGGAEDPPLTISLKCIAVEIWGYIYNGSAYTIVWRIVDVAIMIVYAPKCGELWIQL